MATTVREVPVHNNKFGVKITADATAYSPILNLESLKLSVDNTVESWSTFEDEGYERSLVTGKKISIEGSCKRIYSDAVHNKLFEIAWLTGTDCELPCQWTFPDGRTFQFQGVFAIKNFAGGSKPTDIDTIEFQISVQGRGTLSASV